MTAAKTKIPKSQSSQSRDKAGPVFLPPLRPRPLLFAVMWMVLLLWLAVLVWMRMKTLTPPEVGPMPVPQNQLR